MTIAQQGRVSRRKLFDLVAVSVDLSAIADAAPSVDAAFWETQRDEALAAALTALPPADQLLLKLRFEDDLPVREIAATLKFRSIFHVYRRVAVVCGTLRRSLLARGVEGSAP